MAKRGTNPVRTVRWGAVVMLAAAGTLAALVVSEWPRTGEKIAEQASSKSTRRSPVLADRSMRAPSFTLEEPDPFTQTWPQLVTTGSAIEARRDLEAEIASSPPKSYPSHFCGCDESAFSHVELADYIEWWKTTPNGRIAEEVSAYEPGRTGASVRVAPAMDVSAGVTTFNRGDGPSVGTVELSDGSKPRDAEVYDLSVRLDALGGSSLKQGFSAGLIAGVRNASLFDGLSRDPVVTDPLPVIGGDASIKWSNRSMLRASALGEAPGEIRDYIDLRLEQVWRLGGDASLSLGWRHMRGIMSNEAPTPTLRQDAILLELKIGF